MTTTEAKFSHTIKAGAGLTTVRGETSEELVANAQSLLDNAAGSILAAVERDFVAHVNAGAVVNAQQPYPANVVPIQPQAPQPQTQTSGGWQPPPSPPQAPPQAQSPPPRQCQHGPMQYKNGNSSRGPWQGWFCPLGKDAPGRCDPQFVR